MLDLGTVAKPVHNDQPPGGVPPQDRSMILSVRVSAADRKQSIRGEAAGEPPERRFESRLRKIRVVQNIRDADDVKMVRPRRGAIDEEVFLNQFDCGFTASTDSNKLDGTMPHAVAFVNSSRLADGVL